MTENKKSPHPDWAIVHRIPGTELRVFNNKYYLYEVSSKYNPEKKRAQKITGKLIGRVTEDGLIPSEKRALKEKVFKSIEIKTVSTKEYGACHYLIQQASEIINQLGEFFPEHGKLLFTAAFLRLMHQSPIKNMGIYSNESFIGEFAGKRIDDKIISTMLNKIGSNREPITKYMKQFIDGNDQIMIDMTHIVSYSKRMSITKNGYKKVMDYRPQVNLFYIFSSKHKSPSYYRLTPGNIKEVKAFSLSLKESGLSEATIIADKGFYSNANIEHLKKENLKYILPLRRSSSLIDYSVFDKQEKIGMNGFFKFENRFVWYHSYQIKGENIVLFLDEKLKLDEQHDYLTRIDENKKGYTIEGFRKKQHVFGTIAMVYNGINTEQEIYYNYKSRACIETMFDAGKNILQMDCLYMQNEQTLEGWLFVHHIALQLYYILYNKLVTLKLISKYSVNDMLMFLGQIRKVKINDQWYLAEYTKATQVLLDKIDLHIT